MSDPNTKYRKSKRIAKTGNSARKQYNIAKEHGMNPDSLHKFAKKHAMDCGNPKCFLCGNPRKTHKDKLTVQEKKSNGYWIDKKSW
jgi:hypothetical protein